MSIFTGSDVQRDLLLSCDVCVVGSGAGGAHVAERLASAGRRVVILEEGGYHKSDEFNLNELDMYGLLYQERANRATTDLSIGILQGRAVGGTTVVNWTTCFRTPEPAFQYWAEHFGIEELTFEALVPHWEEIEQRLNVQEVPFESVNRNNRVLWDGAAKLGWEPKLLQRNVKDCFRLGYCGTGCAVDAKQSMLITLLPDAVRAGADLYADAWVERIEASGRKVSKVVARVLDPKSEKKSGATITVEAGQVVLSGGGINNPGVLLRSGVGNSNGRVGKRTFLHPACATSAILPEAVEPYYGAPQSVACHRFARWEGGDMGYFLEVAPMHPMLFGLAAGGFGKTLQESMEKLKYTNATIAILIDGFDPTDPDEGATVGIRRNGRPKVDYKWTPRFIEAIREGTKSCARAQLAGGAVEVKTSHVEPIFIQTEADLAKLDAADFGPNRAKVFSAHVMGGCAMGKDPQASVVDPHLKHHEFDNLFVIDGSVFPTSLGVNPQLSIYGLASWGAEWVRQAG